MAAIELGPIVAENVTIKKRKVVIRKADGSTEERSGSTTEVDTADIVIAVVFILSFALLLVSIFVKSLREAIFTGALPALFAILMTVAGGVEALRIFRK